MTRRPTGGKGSNQYATRGAPTPTAPAKRGSLTAAVSDPDAENVAWRFHPDAARWRNVGIGDGNVAQQWIAVGGRPDQAWAWAQMTEAVGQDQAERDAATDPDLQVVFVTIVRTQSVGDRTGGKVRVADTYEQAVTTAASQLAAMRPAHSRTGFAPLDAVEAAMAHGTMQIHACTVRRDRREEPLVALTIGDWQSEFARLHHSEEEALATLTRFVQTDWDGTMDGATYPDNDAAALRRYFEYGDRTYQIIPIPT